MTKLAILYYSSTGHGKAMADILSTAAQEIGAEVRVRHIAETRDPDTFAENPAWSANYASTKDLPDATGDDIVWADGVILGSPTRFGSTAAPFQTFMDTLGGLWAKGALADKAYAAFTSSQTAHGGQETTLIGLYTSLMHFGAVLVPPGYTDNIKFADGNPYGVSHVTGPENQNEIDGATRAALQHMSVRVVRVASALAENKN